MTEGSRGRHRSHHGCAWVERRRGLAGLVHICLCQNYLLGQVLELVGDLIVVGDLGLVALVHRLLIGVEAADDGLEQGLKLVRRFRHRVQHAACLGGRLGWRRDHAPDRGEPRVGF